MKMPSCSSDGFFQAVGVRFFFSAAHVPREAEGVLLDRGHFPASQSSLASLCLGALRLNGFGQ